MDYNAAERASLVLELLKDRFPDGVDVFPVQNAFVVEYNAWTGKDGLPISKTEELHLNEVEPETGIYAAMSPITHRVYVHLSREFYD